MAAGAYVEAGTTGSQPASKKPARKPFRGSARPFKQGHLDGLCGIYSIVNGFRLVLGRRLNQSKCEQLFDFLTQYAIKEQGNLDVVAGGLGLRQMQQLLAQLSEFLDMCFQGFFIPAISITQP